MTPPLADARERLRRKGIDVTVGELALAGAEQMLAEAEAHEAEQTRRQELRSQLVQALRSGDAFDSEALDYVHEHGWIHT